MTQPASHNPDPVVPPEVLSRRSGEPIQVRRRVGRAGKLVVACILDEFSFNSFGSEADLAPLTMENWLVELTAAQPDLLLVESAWRGHKQSWWNTVHRHGPEIAGIVEWCNTRGIPTAFWNKEDPVHFSTFLTTAAAFDAVFTTDIDCVPRYKAELGHNNVHFLPFAAQPAESNPLEVFERIDGCAFAGAYYEKYPERVNDLAELSAELSTSGRRFDIYDRNFGRYTPGYMFPERYKPLIVGGALTPNMLNIPYKAYTTNLNLNSVKQSQSMFARRVFELMASNTLVVSNFARGLRLMFGDLAITTDSGTEMRRRLDAVESEPNGNERLRAMALRKVLREHTYAERLEFIAEQAGVTLPAPNVERPLLVLDCADGNAQRRAVELLRAQTVDDWRLAILGDEGRGDVHAPDSEEEDSRILRIKRKQLMLIASSVGCTHIGWLDPDDWYGPDYLLDLLQTMRFADTDAAGHVERYVAAADGATSYRVESGTAWSQQPNLLLKRSLVRIHKETDLPWALTTESLSPLSSGPGLAVSPMEYVDGGANVNASALVEAQRLDLDPGRSLDEMREFAMALVSESGTEASLPRLDLSTILVDLAETKDFTLERGVDGTTVLTSTLPDGKHAYWNSRALREIPEDLPGSTRVVYFDLSIGLDAMLVLYYHDESGARVGHSMIGTRRNISLTVPKETAKVRWGLRISGPGSSTLHTLYLSEYAPPPLPLLSRGRTLVVSNIYPSYENLYRNAFVHTRLRSYARSGLRTDVLLPSDNAQPHFREFQDADVATVSSAVLTETLSSNTLRTVVVHTLTPAVWAALRNAKFTGRVLVWVHGFEIQPWWRRRFNYTTPDELDEAKRVSDERMSFWREVFQDDGLNMHFVFVSRLFAESVFEDVGFRLADEAYSIIHNPIDTETFAYHEKDPKLRKRIVSIRPYHSRVYANDLAVMAVLDLQSRDGFEDLHFTFYGDGPLFEETVAPLRGIPNVKIHRQFLTHQEIASVHRKHGVLLVPSRSDTQGVSRDEAMSSGLVPVTSAVAAIPEFVDERTAMIAPAEDHQALAEGVWALSQDPDLFARMSVAASQRVRRQSGHQLVIEQELKLVAEN